MVLLVEDIQRGGVTRAALTFTRHSLLWQLAGAEGGGAVCCRRRRRWNNNNDLSYQHHTL